jgi:hypothetical protein
VFAVLSWFTYDGIDVFFNLIYHPIKEKTEKKEPEPEQTTRTVYESKDAKKERIIRDDTTAPDTRYITTKREVPRESAFEKFLNRIFPQQLDYVLNPYSFFLILIFTILPLIGIFIYLIIYYFR